MPKTGIISEADKNKRQAMVAIRMKIKAKKMTDRFFQTLSRPLGTAFSTYTCEVLPSNFFILLRCNQCLILFNK